MADSSVRPAMLVRAIIPLLLALLFCSNQISADESLAILTQSQQQTLLSEADKLYAQATSATDSAEANAALAAAISRYQLVADTGLRSPWLFFNLGNAQLKVGETGRAIASFEQARRFSPRDRRIAANLRHARKQLVSADDASNESVGKVVTEWIGAWRSPAQTLAWFCWLVFWIVAVAWLFMGQRSYSRPVLIGCSIVFLIAVILRLIVGESNFDGITISDTTSLRKADGESFPVLDELSPGHRVLFQEARGDWIKIKPLGSHQAGWVRRDSVYQMRS